MVAISIRLKWLLVAFTLIGAALGLAITLMIGVPVLGRADALWQVKFIFFVVAALYVPGGVAGVRFAQKTARRGLLRFYYALQVVALSSPYLELRFFSGGHLLPSLSPRPLPTRFLNSKALE